MPYVDSVDGYLTCQKRPSPSLLDIQDVQT
jgi:hypothetical protein